MKRLSITNSGELVERLFRSPPTVGMLKAFQFGADMWSFITVGTNHGQSDEIALHRCREQFRDCHRITISNSLMPAHQGRTAIQVEIRGYMKFEQKLSRCLIISFDKITGEIIR